VVAIDGGAEPCAPPAATSRCLAAPPSRAGRVRQSAGHWPVEVFAVGFAMPCSNQGVAVNPSRGPLKVDEGPGRKHVGDASRGIGVEQDARHSTDSSASQVLGGPDGQGLRSRAAVLLGPRRLKAGVTWLGLRCPGARAPIGS